MESTYLHSYNTISFYGTINQQLVILRNILYGVQIFFKWNEKHIFDTNKYSLKTLIFCWSSFGSIEHAPSQGIRQPIPKEIFHLHVALVTIVVLFIRYCVDLKQEWWMFNKFLWPPKIVSFFFYGLPTYLVKTKCKVLFSNTSRKSNHFPFFAS